MLVGRSGKGKTSTYQTLLSALESVESVESVCHVLDAKIISKDTLFGFLDATTREWTDGIFTSILRKIVENLRGENKKRYWIIFNGDVDPEWVENLNSVLDDNKVLTLPNGERIELLANVRLIFEVENLKYATPATISRCGMIWYGDDIVNASMYFQSELHRLKRSDIEDTEDEPIPISTEMTRERILDRVNEMLHKIFQETSIEDIIVKAEQLVHIMEFSYSRAISSFFSLLKSSCLNYQRLKSQDDFAPSQELIDGYILRTILSSLLWSFSGDSSLEDRKKYGKYLLQLAPFVNSSPADPFDSLLDFDVSADNGQWIPWVNRVPQVELESQAVVSTDAVVPTIDTQRHQDLIYRLLQDHKPVLLCGPPGSGKTMTLFSALRQSRNMDVMGLNFSKSTTPTLLIKSLEQHCTYHRTINGTVLSPTQIGRWLVVFCDEINLPANDKYGTQRVISLLRQMIEENGFWKEDERKWVSLSRVQFVGACNPPTDAGRTPLSARFLRHTAIILVDSPGTLSLEQIYLTFNRSILKSIPSLRHFSDSLTNAMIEVFVRSKEHFTSQQSSHYIYSPRELTRWCRGIFEAIRHWDELSDEGLIRLWAHEGLRLFSDRLIGKHERDWTWDMIREVASKHFPGADVRTALNGSILYSSWLSRTYSPVEQETLRQFIKARMKTFCEEELDTPLVLFDDLLDHILRIDRVLRQPQGHLILIGVSSSGKVSLIH
ncbi:dynein heavy chain [Sugiyamaella lignohabitans]|uniref:Dynein heavy chain n=1 Tax=Sugiyamaella lignohabitans TaxID=796027 RepID=A0A167FIS8_9ASCO|nr:dynein heavy chain [Sugiyamaella lignohabitans]ANB15356.1 dynein heavy chain [Sugiyamaella lignohabitans]